MAGEHTEPPDGSSVADQALQWFVLLQSGHATSADRRKFHEWIGADALRRQEFEQCSKVWRELDSVKPLLCEELSEAARRPVSRTVPRRQWALSAALTAILVVFVGAGWWITTGFETAEYRTAKGERRTVVLPDGAMMTLNTETVVAIEFSFTKRSLVLREGEALFAVAHADRRPFEVLAGDRVVRDVGTQFVVRRRDQAVAITVVEGAVEVQRVPQEAPVQSWQRLTAAEQVSYRQGDPLSPVKAVSLGAITAWVEGKAFFEERPLSEVIEEMGRYQEGEVRILDHRVGELKVSGVFSVNDREGFLNALERAVPVTVSHVNRNLVILEQRSPSEQR